MPTPGSPGKLRALDEPASTRGRDSIHVANVSQSPTVNSRSNGALPEGSLDDAYEHCRRVTRHHAKSFYFCAAFLPPLKRRAIYAVYALCRTIDDFVDRSADRDAADTRAILDKSFKFSSNNS